MIDLLSVTSMSGRPESGARARSGDFSHALEKATPKGAESAKDAVRPQGSGRQDEQAGDRTDIKAGDIAVVAAADGEAHGEATAGPLPTPLVASLERVLSARIFGLHAQASGYLSELALSSQLHEALAPPQRSEVLAGSRDVSTGFDVVVETPRTEALGSEDMAGGAMPVDSPGEMHASWAPDDVAPAPPGMPGAAGDAVAWQERSLRVIHRLDGKQVIWLRDYTLSPDQAHRLAQELVRHGQAQGMSLHSILWNGHEIWPSTGNEQGE
ncbi:hypothetical protein [Dyella sedimenti]|uniref:hypothetical protein n=1 Tax=Dyella sedimenti TaxID=2919947 RepID=UPI001FAA9FE9|nr:hypothetical protein [Dyella sedimenti]